MDVSDVSDNASDASVARLRRMVFKASRTVVLIFGAAYPAALLVTAVMLRWIGDRWWFTAVLLYLPRAGFLAPLPFIAAGLVGFRMWRLLLVQIASVLLVVFPLMGFVLPGAGFAKGGAATVRVLSFNVEGCDGGYKAVYDEIDAHTPDVVLLQEVGNADDLVRVLREHYPVVQWSGQFIVASRYPTVAGTAPGYLDYNGRQRSPRFLKESIDTPLGPIVFYNVHPISPREGLVILKTHGIRAALLGRSHGPLTENVGLRTLQVQTFLDEAAAETGPVIVAGDTNLPDPSVTLRRYESRFTDAFRAAGWGFGYTFPTDKKWGPAMRLDRIFTSEKLRATRFEVGRSRASDHHCVVADITRAP
jgi:endonuclease/exonuclease/phosphatase (EEP) superfamily protein YafD